MQCPACGHQTRSTVLSCLACGWQSDELLRPAESVPVSADSRSSPARIPIINLVTLAWLLFATALPLFYAVAAHSPMVALGSLIWAPLLVLRLRTLRPKSPGR